MRLTIIVEDNAVYVDGITHPLDLSSCGIPADVHALQWYGTHGWVEFRDSNDPSTPKPANQEITELPAWGNAAKVVFDAWTPPPEPEADVHHEPVTPPAA